MESAKQYPFHNDVARQPFSTNLELKTGSYGVYDTLRQGFSSAQKQATPAHPLEFEQKTHLMRRQQREFDMLRNTQGLHMPMKLQMERALAAKVQRLPGLPSSNLALRTLMDIDDDIGFEDFLNNPMEQETMGDYREMWERQEGLL